MIGQKTDHPSPQEPASAKRRRGRGSRENVALQLELANFAPQAGQLFLPGRRQRRIRRPRLPASFLPIGLDNPVPDRLNAFPA